MISGPSNITIKREDLLRAGIAQKTLEQAVTRRQVAVVSRGSYLYSTFPETWKEQIKMTLFGGLEPEAHKVLEAQKTLEAIPQMLKGQLTTCLERGYALYLQEYVPLGVGRQKARQLAEAAACLDCICSWMLREGIGSRKLSFLEEVAAMLLELEVKYLPTHPRRLQEKVRMMLDEKQSATEIIKLPRANNLNAAVYKTHEILNAAMIELRCHPANFTNSHIARHLMQASQMLGLKAPSEAWFKAEFAKPAMKTLAATTSRFNQGSRQAYKYTSYIPTAGAAHAGDCWHIDGTRVNLAPHTPDPRMSKSRGIAKAQFLYIIAVRDVFSGCIVGMHLDYTEDRWAWISALKSAIQNTNHLPYEMVVDRFPGHKSQEWKELATRFEAMGVKLTYATGPTQKAQLERNFGTLQTVFMQSSPFYYGQGIQSKTDYAHRTEAYLKSLKKTYPDFDFTDAVRETAGIVDRYNSTPLKVYSRKHALVAECPVDLYEETLRPFVTELDARQSMWLLGERRVVTLASHMLKLQVANEEYLFRFENATYGHSQNYHSIINHYSGTKVTVVINPEEPTEAHVYSSESDHLLAICPRFDRIQASGPTAKLGQLSALKAKQRSLVAANMRTLNEAKQLTAGVVPSAMYLQAGEMDELTLMMPRSTPKSLLEENESAATRIRSPYDPEREEGGILD